MIWQGGKQYLSENKPIRLNDNLQLKYDINKSTTLTYRFKVMSNDKHVANDFISDSLSTYTTKRNPPISKTPSISHTHWKTRRQSS